MARRLHPRAPLLISRHAQAFMCPEIRSIHIIGGLNSAISGRGMSQDASAYGSGNHGSFETKGISQHAGTESEGHPPPTRDKRGTRTAVFSPQRASGAR